jgi:hypothetical protein
VSKRIAIKGARFKCRRQPFASAKEIEVGKVSNSFIAQLYNFEDSAQALLVLVNEDTLRWLMSRFEEIGSASSELNPPAFTIGNGNPIGSDGLCLLEVKVSHVTRGNELLSVSRGRFLWCMSRSSAVQFRELLAGMLAFKQPCHQYLEPDNYPPAPVIIVSKDQYTIEQVRNWIHHDITVG